ncbi:MAG: cation:proton antiporter [Ferruginibacter sp.]
MQIAIVITICLLLLLAYFFDVTSSRSGVPTVVFLLILGWGARQAVNSMDISVPSFDMILPIIGTIGLILIVLEGSIELELNKKKLPFVRKSFFVAIVPILSFSLLFALILSYLQGVDYKTALANIVPFSVISSSIAIPSARNLPTYQREFVVYESSMSDILGVMLFNFVALNSIISFESFALFVGQLLIIAAVSFAATLLLSYLLGKIDHEIKFIPMIVLVILVYELSKLMHLPSLVFIMIFGLFLGNLDELKHIKWIHNLKPENFNEEVHKFSSFLKEATFLVRSLFFLLFGFIITNEELLNTESLAWAVAIVAIIFLIRTIQLKASGLPYNSLLYIAPRGLINILLFLSLPASVAMPLFGNAMLVQVMILTVLVMFVGLMFTGKKVKAR